MLHIIKYNCMTKDYTYSNSDSMLTVTVNDIYHGINKFFITDDIEVCNKKIEELEKEFKKKY